MSLQQWGRLTSKIWVLAAVSNIQSRRPLTQLPHTYHCTRRLEIRGLQQSASHVHLGCVFVGVCIHNDAWSIPKTYKSSECSVHMISVQPPTSECRKTILIFI